MSDCPLWPDEFDTAALKRAGYSYREVREMFPVWEASIPLHERKRPRLMWPRSSTASTPRSTDSVALSESRRGTTKIVWA